MTLLITYLLVAVLVSFLCAILEAVLLSSTPSYIESLSKTMNSNTVEMLRELKSNTNRSVSSILILNNFVLILGAAGVGAQSQMEATIAIILAFCLLYFSEIIPKTIGAIYWKKLLIPSAYIINFLIKVLYPLVWISMFLTNAISKGKIKESTFSRDEIMAAVTMGEKEGSILSKESALIENLFKLKNIKTKDIMTPRSVVFALKSDITVEEAIEEDKMYIHSRIPIFTDTIDDVIGIVFNQNILEQSVEEKD